ncbi:MAG: DUF4249 family protein [Bacteroidota bacterium]
MKKFILICFVSILTMYLSGCSKSELDDDLFENPASQYELAVEGGINTYSSVQYIRLSQPASHPDSVPTPVRKASVIVNDGRADIVFRETSNHGVYIGISTGDPNYNNAYKLTIKSGSKTYTAVDTLRQVVNIVDDFLPLSTHLTTDGKVELRIPKHTFGYLNPNKWFMVPAPTLPLPPNTPILPLWNLANFDENKNYSYTHFLGSPNSLYPLSNLNRSLQFDPEQFIYIYKISLSEKYAQYLYSVFMETDWNGLFSGVPVNIQGNISGNAQGYFSAVDVDRRRYAAKEL